MDGDRQQELISFCRREHGRLVGLLSLYCGDAAIAEELAQDALARVCRDWRRVRRMDQPGAWANRVAINLANSYFRRRAAERRARERLASRLAATPPEPDSALALGVRQASAVRCPRASARRCCSTTSATSPSRR